MPITRFLTSMLDIEAHDDFVQGCCRRFLKIVAAEAFQKIVSDLCSPPSYFAFFPSSAIEITRNVFSDNIN